MKTRTCFASDTMNNNSKAWSSSVEGDTALLLRFPFQQKARSLLLLQWFLFW